MDRAEAVCLLKEMISLSLVQPSWISIEKNDHGTFNLVMKADGNLTDILAFLVDKNLIISENEETGICTIYRL